MISMDCLIRGRGILAMTKKAEYPHSRRLNSASPVTEAVLAGAIFVRLPFIRGEFYRLEATSL